MPSPTPPVLIARELLAPGRELLKDRVEIRVGGDDAAVEDLLRLADGVEAVILDANDRIDSALLDAAGDGLRIVANVAVGFDNIDLDACRERGVVVTNTPDVLTNATAELALALTFAAARGLYTAEADLRDGRWTGWAPSGYLGTELSGASFGIVGLGRIGRRYAELVRPLAGQIVHATSSPKADAERALGIERVALDELLARSDVVSLHAPARPETRHMIDARALERMRPDAILVNTARGALVDSEALAGALRDGRIAAAGVDVYEAEPDVPDSLLEAPNCVLLPHIGSATATARNAMARLAAENVIAVLDGGEPLTPVS